MSIPVSMSGGSSSTGSSGGAPASPFDPMAMAGGGAGGQLMEKDSFMKLLVTQLSTQDPMSPSDPTQFVSQLAQFTSLEQLVSVNEGLNVIAMTEAAATSAQMVSYVGKDVVVADDKLYLDGSGADQDLAFELDSNASEVTVTITDENGDVVRTLDLGSESAGQVNVSFDGRDDDGDVLPQGTYTYEVTATDADGEPVGVNQMSRGHVTSVVFENGYPELMLSDGRRMPLGQVLQVTEAGAGSGPYSAANDLTEPGDDAGEADTPAPQPEGDYGVGPNQGTGSADDDSNPTQPQEV